MAFQSRAVVRRWVSGQRRQPIQWLTLKVHVLKNGSGLRVLKDLTDVAPLLLVNCQLVRCAPRLLDTSFLDGSGCLGAVCFS